MYGKRILRKPLLAVLLLVIILLGVLFPAVLGKSMEKNYAELEGLYEGMTIRCELLPPNQLVQDSLLDPEFGRQITEMDEVASYNCELQCPYYLRVPGPSTGNSLAYGTNNLEWFAERHNLTYELAENCETVDFSGNENICLVSRQLSERLSRKPGDTITVAGSARMDEADVTAPDLALTVVGTFRSEETDVPWNAVITPSSCFLEDGKLITSAEGVDRWRRYQKFEFLIDSSYNRSFDSVKESLEQVIGTKWMLYSTSRELYNAVQPLERKLDMQQVIYRLMMALFLVLPAVITVLICLKEKKEILIRIVYGEEAGQVFLTCWLSVCALLCLAEFISVGIGAVFGKVNVWYAAGMLLLSMSAAAVTIGGISRRRLVKLYQSSREE